MSQRVLISLQGLPVLQNRTFPTREDALASAVGNLELVQDLSTGLVHNRAFDPAILRYDAEYQNEQAHSDVFKRHLDDVCLLVDRHFSGRRLAEIGCGKGYFFELLEKHGYDIVGVDPAYEGSNPRVIRAPFDRRLGLRVDALILRHVLEHIVDPVAFLGELAVANGGRGYIYIEVPCFDWILRRRAWFDLFYEHVNYFRHCDFERMFGGIIESGHLFGGQYLYVVADLATLRMPTATAAEAIRPPDDIFAGMHSLRDTMLNRRRNCAIWGASSKGVLFSLHLARAGCQPDFAIDLNPAKHGRFLPATGLAVLSPAAAMERLAPGDDVIVMNSNYLPEIREQSGHRFTYRTVDHE